MRATPAGLWDTVCRRWCNLQECPRQQWTLERGAARARACQVDALSSAVAANTHLPHPPTPKLRHPLCSVPATAGVSNVRVRPMAMQGSRGCTWAYKCALAQQNARGVRILTRFFESTACSSSLQWGLPHIHHWVHPVTAFSQTKTTSVPHTHARTHKGATSLPSPQHRPCCCCGGPLELHMSPT
jgi:hypothetical protein